MKSEWALPQIIFSVWYEEGPLWFLVCTKLSKSLYFAPRQCVLLPCHAHSRQEPVMEGSYFLRVLISSAPDKVALSLPITV